MRALGLTSTRRTDCLTSLFQITFVPARTRWSYRHFASIPSIAIMSEGQGTARNKLHGRDFYKSIGSPKMILAPMVEQSEFVRQ